MKLYHRLTRYLRPYRRTLAIAIVCMVIVAALNALRVYLIKPLQDEVFIAGHLDTLARILVALPILSIGLGAAGYAQNYLMSSVGQRAVADLRQEMFDHIQGMSMDFFGASSTGRVIARFTNDLAALQQFIVRAPVYCVRDGLTFLGYIVMMFYLNWRFTLMTLCILPISGGLIGVLGKRLRRVGRQGQAQMGELYSVIQENLQSAAVVKAYTAEPTESARMRAANARWLGLTLRFARTDTLSSPLMEAVGVLVLSFLLWKGGAAVMAGKWSAGSFLTLMTYALLSYRPLKNFAEANAQYQLGLASSERVFELLDQKPTVTQSPTAAVLPGFSKEIVYENVTLHYASRQSAAQTDSTASSPAEKAALESVRLRIRAGEVVALVGSSGSGKSSLAALLPRFYDPTEGRITIDGHDLRDLTFESLRRQIGLVTQEVILFNESVRYNIAYGRPGASEAEIEEAAKAANAHTFISRLPHGYDTMIGERGTRLSGGERQRVSIARAILKNPPILILDEATSALDAESERLVQEALERLMEHRTAIVIAHRLSTVRRADRIVVMDHGRISEEGSHEELVAHGGIYHKLHNLQLLQ